VRTELCAGFVQGYRASCRLDQHVALKVNGLLQRVEVTVQHIFLPTFLPFCHLLDGQSKEKRRDIECRVLAGRSCPSLLAAKEDKERIQKGLEIDAYHAQENDCR
jgi:hypothetical protein